MLCRSEKKNKKRKAIRYKYTHTHGLILEFHPRYERQIYRCIIVFIVHLHFGIDSFRCQESYYYNIAYPIYIISWNIECIGYPTSNIQNLYTIYILPYCNRISISYKYYYFMYLDPLSFYVSFNMLYVTIQFSFEIFFNSSSFCGRGIKNVNTQRHFENETFVWRENVRKTLS